MSKTPSKWPFLNFAHKIFWLFGKIILDSLKKEIINKSVKDIYIALDNDARSKALDICQYFINNGIKVHLIELDDKDPSELGFKRFWKIAEEAKPFKFSDVVKGRLYA